MSAMIFLVVVCCLLVAATVVRGQLSSYYCPERVNELYSFAGSKLQEVASLKEVYYSAELLRSSNQPVPCNCKKLEEAISAVTKAYDAYYGIISNDACGCGLSYDRDAMLRIVKSSMEAQDLYSNAGAVLAAHALGELSTDEKLSVMERTLALMTPEGKFKSAPESDDSSLDNLHTVLEMLSIFSIDQNAPDIAADVFEKAFQLIPSGEGERESDVLLIVPLSKLTDKKLRLVGSRLVIAAELLLNLQYSSDIVVLAKVHEAIRIVSTYKASPLYIKLEKNVLSTDASSQQLALTVQDVYGSFVTCDGIEATAVQAIGAETTALQGLKFDGNTLNLASGGEALTMGRYKLSLSLNVVGRTKPLVHQVYFTVAQEVEVKDVLVGVADADGELITDMTPVESQNSITSNALSASAVSGESIRTEYIVMGTGRTKAITKPHQSFFRLANLATGKSAYAVGISSDASDDSSSKYFTYSATLSLVDMIERLEYTSGVLYTLSIIVGDVLLTQPVEFTLGTIDIRMPSKQQTTYPLYAKALLHTSDTTLTALPEIEHQMRPPAKRASSFMAASFTILTCLPLVVFLGVVLHLQLNIKRLKSISSVGFVFCLAATLALFVGYWLSLDGFSFYQTIKFICFLFPLTAFVGRYALMSVAEVREGEKTKEA